MIRHAHARRRLRALALAAALWVGAAPALAEALPAKLVFGSDRDFPPFSFVDESGQPAGFTVDLVRALGRATGREIEVRLGPWAEIRAQLEQGEGVDFVDMYESEERAKHFAFSDPIQLAADEIFVRVDSPAACSATDLTNRRVLVESKSFAYEFILRRHPEAVTLAAMSEPAALRRLATGEGDCALVSQFAGRYMIQKFGLTDLTVTGPPLSPRNHSFAVRRGDEALLAELNRGLELVRASGRYGEVSERWLTPIEPKPVGVLEVLRGAALFLVPIGLVALGALGWSWTLRRRVRERTRELANELAERRRAHQALGESEQRFRALVEDAPEAIFVIDTERGEVEEINQKALRLLALSDSQPRMKLDELVRDGEARAELDAGLEAALAGERRTLELTLLTANGEPRTCELRLVRLPTGDRKLVRVSANDIEERQQAEQVAARSQRMESLGRLAGGVAHDFNNLLSIITVHGELLRAARTQDRPLSESLDAMLGACERAAALTRQLSAFGRRQMSQPKLLSLNALVRDMQKLLERTLSEDIVLSVDLAEDTGQVRADPSQLEQIVLNLAINARDAMPSGGRLVIRTRAEQRETAGADGVPAGDWAVLEVTDSGAGVAPELRARIFEPFFTTKEVTGGTGLGLATAYGIAAAAGGQVTLESEVGRGSTFSVYLPRSTAPAEPGEVRAAPPAKSRRASLLLVEDEPQLRAALGRILVDAGYSVVLAADAEEALMLHAAMEPEPDALVTDLVMPGLGGRKLADLLRERQPDLPVLFMTGYTDDALLRDGELPRASRLLTKPFGADRIRSEVEQLLRR